MIEAHNVTIRVFLWIFLLITLLGVLEGCASYKPEEKTRIDLVWPLPPEKPRIRYVNSITGTSQLKKKQGFADAFFGGQKNISFGRPHGVAVDSNGRMYVTDSGRVWVLDLKNISVGFIGDQPGEGRLSNPIGIAVSSDGRVFVSDTALDRVFVYEEGRLVGALGVKREFEGAVGIALDEERELFYIADAKKHRVSAYSLKDYRKIRTMGKRGTGEGEFNYPTNVEVDPEGRLYIVDTGNFRVQIFDHGGKFIKSLGQVGDTPGSFARPKGIALDSEGHIYVVDSAFQNFQIFDFEGNILLAVGSGGTAEGEFLLPADIAIDDEDMIYVVNQMPPNIQIFEYLGQKSRKREAEKRW
jgi:DNA-binding beta-propeller fold protein YncE